MRLETTFEGSLPTPWDVRAFGTGQTQIANGALRLTLPAGSSTRYGDAQISDYRDGRGYRWRPPVRLTVRARAEVTRSEGAYPLTGTAGFGFWNQPFMPGQRRLRLPRAVWFFYSSPPSDMRLAKDVPGPGWKAATFDAFNWRFAALIPAAPIGFLLMRHRRFFDRWWPLGQRAIGVSEALLESALLAETHTYTVDWQRDGVTFRVDRREVHRTDCSPGGPLGFIAWLDNQYARVTPQGEFRFGLVDVLQPQTLVIESIVIEDRDETRAG